MEKGHYGEYTGNARHARKQEMIHDRELIYDAKKQLHDADKDYKKDSSSFHMQGDLDKDGEMSGYEANRQKKISEAMSNAPSQMNADSKYDPVNDIADSPVENSGLGPKTAGSGLYFRACGRK